MLETMDKLERVPEFYHRRKEEVATVSGGKEECWLYVLPRFKRELLEKRMLEEWTTADPALDKYVERWPA